MDRNKFRFDYFFNAGLDKVTGICDGEGSDVFERDDSGGLHYIGSLYGYLPEDISEMSDEEFQEAIRVSFIPSKEPEVQDFVREIVVWDE